MRKFLSIVSVLMLTISCRTNQEIPVAITTVPKVQKVTKAFSPDNSEKVSSQAAELKNSSIQETNVAKENSQEDSKPVVLKRMMRRPVVI